MTEKTTKFENFVRVIVCLFAVFFMGILSLASLFSTTGMEIVGDGQGTSSIVNTIPQGLEVVWYYHDNIFANLIWLALCAVICFAVMPWLQKLSLKKEIIIVMVWTMVLGTIWVVSSQVMPSEDSGTVTSAAVRAAQNDFEWMELPYFNKFYPFQLGYVLFNEVLIRFHNLFKPTQTLIYLEILNVFFLACIYAGILVLMDRLFPDQKIRQLTGFLMLFSIQPIIACSFLYGIYPGMVFAVWAIVFEVLYFQTENPPFMIFSVLFIALAYTIKPNYLICLIAMMIIAGVKFFSFLKNPRKMAVCAAYMILACVMSLSLPKAATARYTSVSDVEIGDSMPLVSYFVMGMHEAENAPGWYTYWPTVSNFENHNYNKKEAAAASVEEIKKRLEYFSEHKEYRNEFYYKKFVSQWNETSYQSIWNNKVRMQYKEKGKISAWVCNDGEHKVKYYMDIYAQLIFAGVFLGCLTSFRNKSLMQMALPLVVIGGMMYHLLSESKSQYAMPYFIMMTGFAAVGICWLYDKYWPYFLEKIPKFKKEKSDTHERNQEPDQTQQAPEPDSAA